MKRFLLIGLLLFTAQWVCGQHFPMINSRNYVSDSISVMPPNPWRASAEVFGLNMAVWAFDRYVVNEDFARISWNTIKNNFKTGPVWDTDKFSTNLFGHPFHGSLYYNAARSNGLNFWQSVPFVAGGSLMWEFFMEAEPPSINDMLSTTFGGIELGEITYRLSDLFIDNRSSGAERVGREILSGIISPVRGLNRLITGEAWRHSPSKGRTYSSVPINFIVSMGPRFLAEQDKPKSGTASMNINFRLDYGDPFNDEFYSPYEWFQFRLGLDLFSAQPFVSQVNAIGALWGKRIWSKDSRRLTAGVFQHFDYYDSGLRPDSEEKVPPYRISEAAALGGGLIYYKEATQDDPVDIFGELYATGIALGASISDYLKLQERDYNLGSGYSIKAYTGMYYKKRFGIMLNLENYHIFTWKGYDPDIDWNVVDATKLNVQGDNSDARLTIFSTRLFYLIKNRWTISLVNRYFSRRTNYKYYDNVNSSSYDVMLTFGVRI